MSTNRATPKPLRSTGRHAKTRGTGGLVESSFAEVVGLIQQARQRAYQAVNAELVDLYLQIGQYISGKLEAAEWGEGVVDRLAQHLARTMLGLRGFSVQNLWRMRQFFETYRDDPKLSPLVRVLPWTHNLIILGQSKRPEERKFSPQFRTTVMYILAICATTFHVKQETSS